MTAIGSQIGPYRLVRELGSGRTSRVYLAEPTMTAAGSGRQVAVKFFHSHVLRVPGLLDKLVDDVEQSRAVAHPNLVRTLDLATLPESSPPVPFLVLEYVPGQTLRELLVEMGQVPEELCLHVAREVTRALGAVHAAGLVHRDLRPENVIITAEHAVKLLNLGLARVAEAAMQVSAGDALADSTRYAAPEQLAGGDPVLDGRSDLHALGILLHELSTGRHPFPGMDVRVVVDRIVGEVPEPVGRLNPQLSAFFEEVVRTLLEKDPARRFSSAIELGTVLAEGEHSTWWRKRTTEIRMMTLRPPRRVRVPRETALHGREVELEKLGALYQKVLTGQGQVVLVEGEAGIGKTRLVDEFVGELRERGEDPHFLFGGYPPGGAATGTGAFAAALREHFGEEGLDDALAAHLTVTPLLVPAFAALLRGDAQPRQVEPLTRESLPTAFVHVTRSLAAERPVVMLIEDLHFAPEEGRALFTALALAVAPHRLLLVGTMRPGLPPPWIASIVGLGHAELLPVSRLGSPELAELLADALHSVDLSAELAPQIAAKSDGNPFFVFEILRELREGRLLTRDGRGRWIRTRNIGEIQIPGSVLDLIQARIANLSEEDRELLEVSSCAGFEFDPTLVSLALEQELIPTLRRFAKIERDERLVRAAGRRYVFDHHQVQEVLYAGVFAGLREHYHSALGAALEVREQVAGKDPRHLRPEVVVALCEHFLAGGEATRAHGYLDAALTALEDRYQNAGAADLAARALAVPDLLGGRERCEVLLRRAMRLDLAGHREEEAATLDEARRIAEEIGDPDLKARVLGRLGWHHAQAGDPTTARDLLAAAVALTAAAGDRGAESGIRRRYGDILHSLGEHERAAHELESALALAVAAGDRSAEAKATGDLGLAMRSLGNVKEARRLQERCLMLSRELGDRMGEAAAEGNLGVLLADGGDPEGFAHQERQLVLCRDIGYRRGEAIATGNLGTRLFEQGRFDEARQRYERHLALSEEIGFKQGEAIAVGNLGVLFLQLGRLADAKAYDERHLALCREIGYRRGEAIAEGNLGDVCLLLGDTETARSHIEGALERARALGSAVLESFALHSLARVVEQAGEAGRVEPLYRQALERRQSAGFTAGVPGSLIALGWWLVSEGRRDEGQPMLAEALTAAREMELVDEELLASVYLATLPGGDPEAATRAFMERAEKLGVRIRMEIHHVLWKLTGDPHQLDAAKQVLTGLVAGAPPAFRDGMIANVPLHHELHEAEGDRARASVERGSRPEGTG